MRITLIFSILVMLAAAPSRAIVVACDAASQASGYCTPPEKLLCYGVDPAWLAKLVADVNEQFGYPTITCAPADVAAARCTSGQLGMAVTTPETAEQFANRMFGVLLALRVYERDKRIAAATAAASVTVPQPID